MPTFERKERPVISDSAYLKFRLRRLEYIHKQLEECKNEADKGDVCDEAKASRCQEYVAELVDSISRSRETDARIEKESAKEQLSHKNSPIPPSGNKRARGSSEDMPIVEADTVVKDSTDSHSLTPRTRAFRRTSTLRESVRHLFSPSNSTTVRDSASVPSSKQMKKRRRGSVQFTRTRTEVRGTGMINVPGKGPSPGNRRRRFSLGIMKKNDFPEPEAQNLEKRAAPFQGNSEKGALAASLSGKQQTRPLASGSTAKSGEESRSFNKALENADKKDAESTITSTKYIIMPDSDFRMRWDLIMLVLVVYYAVTVPVVIAFSTTQPWVAETSKFGDAMNVVFTLIFALDIVLNFNTGYTEKGKMVVDHAKIAKNYFRFWFMIDFIATFPISEIYTAAQKSSGESTSSIKGLSNINRSLRLLRIFKLFRVFKISRIMKRVVEYTKFNPPAIRLMQISFFMIFAWHWIASGYWLIADVEIFGVNGSRWHREGGNIWLPASKIWCMSYADCNETACDESPVTCGWATNNASHYEDFYNPFRGVTDCFDFASPMVLANETVNECTSFSVQYLSSVYFAVMATTGLGWDITPITLLEHVFSTFMIVIGVAMYAVVIGNASSALSSLDSSSAEKRQRLQAVELYLRENKVSLDLQKRVREYFEYMWQCHQALSISKGGGALRDLHPSLRLELHLALHRDIVERIPMFKAISDADPACLVEILLLLEPKLFVPSEYIILQGEVGCEMYVIVRGLVEVTVDNIPVAELGDGQVFGERALLTRQKRNASVITISYCDTLMLDKDHFDSVMEKYPSLMNHIVRLSGSQRRGWDRIREIVKSLKVCRMLGSDELNMRKMLMGGENEAEKGKAAKENEAGATKAKSQTTRRWLKVKTAVRALSRFRDSGISSPMSATSSSNSN